MSLIARETIGSGLPGGLNSANPEQSIAYFFSWIIYFVFLVAGLFVGYFLLTGALNWITSNGDKEKIDKARKTMTSAVIGLVILFAVFAVWMLIASDMLGIVQRSGTGFTIKLPSLIQ